MTVGETVRQAVRTKDGALAVRVAEMLRAAGYTYRATYETARHLCTLDGIDLEEAEWDGLLYEGEEGEA